MPPSSDRYGRTVSLKSCSNDYVIAVTNVESAADPTAATQWSCRGSVLRVFRTRPEKQFGQLITKKW